MTPHMFISCCFDTEQGHSSSKQIEKENKKNGESLDYITRLKANSRGLKKGLENNIFWSEIGSEF